MGWERKRGKIEEFNRLLRGATDTSFTVCLGDLALLPSVRYVLTLDADSRLPRNAARSLIGIIAHPLEPAGIRSSGRARDAKASASCNRASASPTRARPGSLFARVYAGHTGVDPYTTAVSDTYQDLFGEGIFTGKGLYDVDAFKAAVERPRTRERPALARSVRGPACAHRTGHRRRGRGRLPGQPARPCATPAPLGARRLADPRVAVPDRAHAPRLRPELAAAHQQVEDLRQPAAQLGRAGAVGAVRCGLDAPAGPAAGAGPSARWPSSRSRSSRPCSTCWRARPCASRPAVYVRGVIEDLSTASAQAFLTLVFLPYHAWEMLHAIA